jgi:hypothetical protein
MSSAVSIAMIRCAPLAGRLDRMTGPIGRPGLDQSLTRA